MSREKKSIKERLRAKAAATIDLIPPPEIDHHALFVKMKEQRVIEKVVVTFNTLHDFLILASRCGDYTTAYRAAEKICQRAHSEPDFYQSVIPHHHLVCRNIFLLEKMMYNPSLISTKAKDSSSKKSKAKEGVRVERVVDGAVKDITARPCTVTDELPDNVVVNKPPIIAIYAYDSTSKWDPNSVKGGIAGSEEAIIYAGAELARKGFKVYVYAAPPPNSPWSLPLSNPCYRQDSEMFTHPSHTIPDAIICWRRINTHSLAKDITMMMTDRGVTQYQADRYHHQLIHPFTGVSYRKDSDKTLYYNTLSVAAASAKRAEFDMKLQQLQKAHPEKHIQMIQPQWSLPFIDKHHATACGAVAGSTSKWSHEKKCNIFYWPHDISTFWINDRDVSALSGAFYLSEYHREGHIRFTSKMAEVPTTIIGNGLIATDFMREVKKVNPYSMMYISNASRGLKRALECWPTIRAKYPTATLKIAYGREHHGTLSAEESKAIWGKVESMKGLGVIEVGKLGHTALHQLCMETSYLLYPCTSTAETYCISLLKALAAGCECFITRVGAMKETMHPECPAVEQITTDAEMKVFTEVVMARLEADTNFPELLAERRVRYRAHALKQTWDHVTDVWLDAIFPAIKIARESKEGKSAVAEVGEKKRSSVKDDVVAVKHDAESAGDAADNAGDAATVKEAEVASAFIYHAAR